MRTKECKTEYNTRTRLKTSYTSRIENPKCKKLIVKIRCFSELNPFVSHQICQFSGCAAFHAFPTVAILATYSSKKPLEKLLDAAQSNFVARAYSTDGTEEI